MIRKTCGGGGGYGGWAHLGSIMNSLIQKCGQVKHTIFLVIEFLIFFF